VTPLASIDDIADLYAARGHLRYGEDVTQMEHALQCAALAEEGGATPALIVAALLHDVGHLLAYADEAGDFTADDRHEAAGASALSGLFDEAVRAPIALHVAAKRWLCRAEPAYQRGLSAASRHSLALQGGPFDAEQAAAFERAPCWRDAVVLRRFDDIGKRDEATRRLFSDYLPIMRALLSASPGP
jgi:phosphonate degradation associated HDIG domain protein